MDKLIRDVDGLLLPSDYSDENLNLMRDIALRPDDIILITYPKCGTNWLGYVTWSILYPEEPAPDSTRVLTDFPYVEMFGLGRWTGTPEDQSRTLVTHMPYDRVAKSKSAKYVVVVRNPMDCVVSLYHFMKFFFKDKLGETEGQEIPTSFFDNFACGNVSYGDFFKHLKSWYAHKDEPNIHLVVFEKMKENPRCEILKLAEFLGHEKLLLANGGQLLDKVVEQSTFSVMKKNVKYTSPMDKTNEVPILRKGEAGGYRKALTPNQIEVLKEKMEKELEGTEILEYWRDV